jgi:hypothetical protein
MMTVRAMAKYQKSGSTTNALAVIHGLKNPRKAVMTATKLNTEAAATTHAFGENRFMENTFTSELALKGIFPQMNKLQVNRTTMNQKPALTKIPTAHRKIFAERVLVRNAKNAVVEKPTRAVAIVNQTGMVGRVSKDGSPRRMNSYANVESSIISVPNRGCSQRELSE